MKYFKIFLILMCIVINVNFAQTGGYALQYDGADDYVNYGNSTAFDVGAEVTYEAWIKPDSSSQGFIFNKWVGFLEDKYVTYSNGRVRFYLFDAFGGTNFPSTPSVPINQYTHIAATYDGSVAKIYINGMLDTSLNVGSNVRNSNGDLFTGSNPNRTGAMNPFGGIIDEFRIWEIAREESEIQLTMNQELNGNETGLVGYWNFNEGTGFTTADQTSNGNDGTINGALWVMSGAPVSVDEDTQILSEFQLLQNFPNPFNPSTKIKYSVPLPSQVQLKVIDVLGNVIETLVNEEKPAGTYEVKFDASDFSSSVYFYQLRVHDFVKTRKMILMK